MNVLITGGTGYIGSHTALVLAQAGHDVVLYDNLRHSSAQVASRLEHLTGRPVQHVIGDVRNTAQLSRTLLENEIDAVVHCAGSKGRVMSYVDPLDNYSQNVFGMICVLQSMAVCEQPRLVFTSSAEVYGESFSVLKDERHPTEPCSPLGRSLLQAETVLRDTLDAADENWRAFILRCFHPAGAHESGLVGDDYGLGQTADSFVCGLGRVAAGELGCALIYNGYKDSPDGSAVRDFTHVMDIAQGHLAALEYMDDVSGLHTANLGRGKAVTKVQTLKAYEAASGQPILHRPADWSSKEVSRSVANPSWAHELLGWQARHSITAICESSWNHLLTLKMLNATRADGVSH